MKISELLRRILRPDLAILVSLCWIFPYLRSFRSRISFWAFLGILVCLFLDALSFSGLLRTLDQWQRVRREDREAARYWMSVVWFCFLPAVVFSAGVFVMSRLSRSPFVYIEVIVTYAAFTILGLVVGLWKLKRAGTLQRIRPPLEPPSTADRTGAA